MTGDIYGPVKHLGFVDHSGVRIASNGGIMLLDDFHQRKQAN